MPLETVTQLYPLPADSAQLRNAPALLEALGLDYTASPMGVVVQMPIIPVLHYFELGGKRDDFRLKIEQYLNRHDAHGLTQGHVTLEDIEGYSADFFSRDAEVALEKDVAPFAVKAHIVRDFAKRGLTVRKITFNVAVEDGRYPPKDSRGGRWFAVVEEVRPVVPDLHELLTLKPAAPAAKVFGTF